MSSTSIKRTHEELSPSSAPSAPSTFVQKPGDWNCLSCAASNFKKNKECFKCKEPNSSAVSNEGLLRLSLNRWITWTPLLASENCKVVKALLGPCVLNITMFFMVLSVYNFGQRGYALVNFSLTDGMRGMH